MNLENFHKIRILIGNQNLRLLFIFIIFICAGIIDFLSLLFLVPFIEGLLGEKPTDLPFLKQSWGDDYSNAELMVFIGASLIIIFIFRALLALYVNHIIYKFGSTFVKKLQLGLMEKFQSFNFDKFVLQESSEYIFEIQSMTEKIQALVENLLRSFAGILISFFIMIFLVFNYPLHFTVLLVTIAILSVVYRFFLFEYLSVLGERVNKGGEILISSIKEAMNGFAEIKIYGVENIFRKQVEIGADLIAENKRRYAMIYTSPQYVFETVFVIIVVIFGLMSLTYSSNDKLASMIGVFGLAALRLRPSIAQMVQAASEYQYSMDHVNKVYKSWTSDGQHFLFVNEVQPENKIKNLSAIVMKNISVDKNRTKILKGISINIEKGEWVGIIGPSGSGKSTLLKVILGLITPSLGSIQYRDKRKEKNINVNLLKENFSYVPQDPFIFNSSIRDNISLSSEKLNPLTIKLALEISALEDFISRLDDNVGEMGGKISGGQRQRLSIARAIYTMRNFLFLDEATSALDKDIESRLMRNIKRWKEGKTIVQVTHNLELVKYFDKLVVLEDGNLSFFGDPNMYHNA